MAVSIEPSMLSSKYMKVHSSLSILSLYCKSFYNIHLLPDQVQVLNVSAQMYTLSSTHSIVEELCMLHGSLFWRSQEDILIVRFQ
jgi:hypothetical protein